MPPFSESTIEQAALSWLEGLGYALTLGPDIASGEPGAEHSDYGAVVLEGRYLVDGVPVEYARPDGSIAGAEAHVIEQATQTVLAQAEVLSRG